MRPLSGPRPTPEPGFARRCQGRWNLCLPAGVALDVHPVVPRRLPDASYRFGASIRWRRACAVITSSVLAVAFGTGPAAGASSVVAVALGTTPATEAAEAQVVTKTFAGRFIPSQVISAGGSVWLVGSRPGGTGCRIGRINASSMVLASYPLQSCGFNATAGHGAVYLETTVADVKDQTYAVHIEDFSVSRHKSSLFPAVSARMFLGSDIAHTQLAYAHGSLWLYATLDDRSSPVVVQLSPTTGQAEHTYAAVPPLGGGEPLITSTPGSLWFAGGAGSGAEFTKLDLATRTLRSIRVPGSFASVYAMSSFADRIVFLYLAPKTGPSPARLYSFIGSLSIDAGNLAKSVAEQVGSTLVSTSGQLFTVGPGSTCTSAITIWHVNTRTLRTRPVVRVVPPGDACLGDSDDRPVAALDGHIFVLYSGPRASELYRVAAG